VIDFLVAVTGEYESSMITAQNIRKEDRDRIAVEKCPVRA
jgi:hypothetical protein